MNYSKIISLSIAGVFLFHAVIAQQNGANKDVKPKPNFFDLRNASMLEYSKKNQSGSAWKEGKEGEYEQFKRWEWYWEQRVNKDGSFPKSSITLDEWRKYVNSHSDAMARATRGASNWTFIGPHTSAGGYEGLGRVSTIAFSPNVADSSTIWVGTPAGGLWKSTNKGNTWSTNTDNLPVLGVSDIAINPVNPNIMYIATGDGDGGSLYASTGDTKSVGILKSTNGGATWDTTGMNWTVQQQKTIRRLAMNPQDPSILLAATSDGIYRSLNEGATWTQTQTGHFIDILFKPGDGNIAYASNKGMGSQIWRTVDGGISWSAVTSFNININRIQLAVTPANPNIVKAVASRYNSTTFAGTNGGVYSSSNSGETFSTYYDSTSANIFGYEYNGSDVTAGQGDYDICMAISPTDSNLVTIGTINAWFSYDGGKTFQIKTMWSNNTNPNSVQVVHSDKHFHAFNPHTGEFWEAGDGGVYMSKNGGLFVDKTNGLQISQFYKLSNSKIHPRIILGGLQDNSCKGKDGNIWFMAAATGDGMEVICDPSDTNTFYVAGPSGAISRTTDQFSNTTSISSKMAGGQKTGSWITPYLLDPNNNQIIYAGFKEVHKSIDRGTTWDSISTNLSVDPLKILAVAPSNSQVIYASDGYKLFVTTNGGASWANPYTSANLISNVSVDFQNSNLLYISISGYVAGSKVLCSTDGGNAFSDMSGTLPNVPATCIIIDKNTAGGLYLATDVGVFYRDSTMTDWQLFNSGLPNVVVNEIEIQYGANKLRAATFGRGMWESDLFSVGVGRKEIESEKSNISISPNPNNGIFTLKVINAKKGDKAFIYNYLGQNVKSIVLKDTKESINLNELKNGIYYVGVESDHFQQLQKFVILK